MADAAGLMAQMDGWVRSGGGRPSSMICHKRARDELLFSDDASANKPLLVHHVSRAPPASRLLPHVHQLALLPGRGH
jgi:hypothetical protein